MQQQQNQQNKQEKYYMLVKRSKEESEREYFSKESMVNCIIYGKLEVIWLETQKQFKYISSLN